VFTAGEQMNCTGDRESGNDYIAIGRLAQVVRRIARQRGLDGEPLAITRPIGTFAEQLAITSLFCDIPKEIRRGKLHEVARKMATACVLSSGWQS